MIATPLCDTLDNPPSFVNMPTDSEKIIDYEPPLMLKRIEEFDYLAESQRTASGKFHGKFVDYNKFVGALNQYQKSAEQLDRYKKLLFYGEDVGKCRTRDRMSNGKDGYSITESFSTDNESEIKARYILHALLGIMTEAGELAELLHNTIVGNLPSGAGGIDTVNLIEECGDLQWYEAMLCRALGTTFDAVQRKNIAKLKARFPDKFTEESANNRDSERERSILETKFSSSSLEFLENAIDQLPPKG